MSRPPSINTERDREIARLRRLLAEFESIPIQRRESELADTRAETVRALLRDLGAEPPLKP
jgi:hypothetical protein